MLGFRPIGAGPISEIRNAQVTTTTTTTVRFASRTFVTRASDAPAHEVIQGRISSGLRINRSLMTVDGQFGGLAETVYGEIQLNNNDGKLDSLATRFSADGRQIRVKIGSTEFDSLGRERVQPYAQFATVYINTAGPWNFEHNVLRLRIESITNRLRDRLQTETYAGTGGAEGTAEMVGLTKPTLFGNGFNISLQLVDPFFLIYQIHAGSIQDVITVYDAGVAVPIVADAPTYADLIVLSMDPGTCATCKAFGLVRLASIPVGSVTADADGHLDNITGNFNQSTGSLIRTILRDYGAIPASQIDQVAFDAFIALQPAAIGLFLPAGDQSTVIDVVTKIAFGAGSFIGERSGLITIQRLDLPGAVVHWAFDNRDIIDIQRVDLPYRIPWKSWGVGYDVNWTIQNDADLAESVTQERRAYLKQTRRYAYVQDTNIALFHATSRGAPLRESFFTDSEDAETEATRLISFYSYGRALYEVVVKTALFSVHLGQTVRLTYHRWDLDGGKDFIVVGIADDADNVRTTLVVFG